MTYVGDALVAIVLQLGAAVPESLPLLVTELLSGVRRPGQRLVARGAGAHDGFDNRGVVVVERLALARTAAPLAVSRTFSSLAAVMASLVALRALACVGTASESEHGHDSDDELKLHLGCYMFMLLVCVLGLLLYCTFILVLYIYF